MFLNEGNSHTSRKRDTLTDWVWKWHRGTNKSWKRVTASLCLHRESSCNSGFRALNSSAPDSLRYKKKVLMTERERRPGRWRPPQARLLRMAELKMMPIRVASMEEHVKQTHTDLKPLVTTGRWETVILSMNVANVDVSIFTIEN